jgi:PmbA protein
VAQPPRNARSSAVVFRGEPLRDGGTSDFWQPFRFHLSAEAAYRKLSRFAPGRSITSGRLAGEPLRLASDPTIRYGRASAPFDRDGLALRRVPLVEAGRLARYWATKEYADYLGVEATGALTNIDVPAGRTPERDLLGDGPVLEVVSFSWFNPDFVTGDFSCEIRLGYERRRGAARPVKGGAVQGNLFAAFRRAQFAREVDWFGTYHGPRAIRFERLTVAGD